LAEIGAKKLTGTVAEQHPDAASKPVSSSTSM
jgi:hypothetical protein